MTEKVDTATLAFTWAALGAAETTLICLSENRPKVREHAQLLLDFVRVGNLGLPTRHYIGQMAKQFPHLAPYQRDANRLLEKMQAEANALAAE